MILRRAKSDPNVAIKELSRDLNRIRSDLDNVRLAVTSRGREVLRDASGRVSKSTTRVGESSREYVQEHPGMVSGIALGILGLVALLFYGMSMRR